ncbi:uncharacterized protein LOC115622870 isoform X2 [Scaptodrosophila lebanonensis]|uniref:Uncharacterized protein LOC115622870 isoform X2 n=1 Tax=Drosophila lebanonensis TaxID=7225 RepID=A0A6J2TCG9_DROLE|nr:uncharacterized protein LOC115622870 isoform X2 [Scaptodrosophila lebanonensis]
MQNEKHKESSSEILKKINSGEYRLVKKNKRSTVWHVYREIERRDGTLLKWRYFCVGCKRVMQSTGGTTSNLRIHKCHMRYLKNNAIIENNAAAREKAQAQRTHNSPKYVAVKGRNTTIYEEYYHGEWDNEEQVSDVDPEDDIQSAEDPTSVVEVPNESEETAEQTPGNARPLFKFFSDESWSVATEEQPIEMDNNPTEIVSPVSFKKETIKPSSMTVEIDANALAEAESYAQAWAHAFLKLNEDQKFYAKRSIDELLVLGRLQRLSLSTVTSLTTNL